MKLKVGDYVRAIKDQNYTHHPEEYFVLQNKTYEVVEIDILTEGPPRVIWPGDNENREDGELGFVILDESGEEHEFEYDFLDKKGSKYLFDKV